MQILRAPRRVPDLVAFIGYEKCGAAADWLVRAFGFEELERFEEGKRGRRVARRQIWS